MVMFGDFDHGSIILFCIYFLVYFSFVFVNSFQIKNGIDNEIGTLYAPSFHSAKARRCIPPFILPVNAAIALLSYSIKKHMRTDKNKKTAVNFSNH